MELNKLSDQQIAKRMVEYIERTQKLLDDVTAVRSRSEENNLQINKDILEEYAKLKQEIRTDAYYLNLSQNIKVKKIDIYEGYFAPSIREAGALGFCAKTNSRIDQNLYDAIDAVSYRLTKYYNLSEWQIIANGESLCNR